MTETNQQLTVDQNRSSLPLKAEKQPTFKIVGITALLIIIVVTNYFIFNKPVQKPIEKKESETYDLSYGKSNPISNATAVNNTPELKSNIDATLERDLAKELQEAKARDFIERLQAPQNGTGGGSASMSGVASAPVDQQPGVVSENRQYFRHFLYKTSLNPSFLSLHPNQ